MRYNFSDGIRPKEDIMKARKTVYILVAALLSALPLAAQKDKAQVVESVWTPTPLQIDQIRVKAVSLWKVFAGALALCTCAQEVRL